MNIDTLDDILNQNFTFNMNEVSFCFHSQAREKEFLSKVIKHFSSRFQVGYVKVSNFSKPSIGSLIETNSSYINKVKYSSYDMVFVEGLVETNCSKFVFMDNTANLPKEVKNGSVKNIAGFIGEFENRPDEVIRFFNDTPYYSLDDLAGIIARTYEIFSSQKPKLNGLIIAGGKSKRANFDKRSFKLNSKSQICSRYEILQEYCSDVFISTKEEDIGHEEFRPYKDKLIFDSFHNLGPWSGLLSAMKDYPDVAWLAIPCDYLLLSSDTISHIVEERDYLKNATYFVHPYDSKPEPLCTIYEPKIYINLLQLLLHRRVNTRAILENSNCKSIPMDSELEFFNANTSKDFEEALSIIDKTL